jgi:acetylornithine aminotransferase
MKNLPASDKIKCVKGRGLMIGIEFNEPMKEIRSKLLFEKHIFTGMAGTNMIRILPPLTLTKAEADEFLAAFKEVVG